MILTGGKPAELPALREVRAAAASLGVSAVAAAWRRSP
jgi:hypothetical protein